MKSQESVLVCSETSQTFPFERWSTFGKAVRIIAWVIRFINRIRKKCLPSKEISGEEHIAAKTVFVKTLQMSQFYKELCLLKEGRPIPRDSKLAKLNPFCDEIGLLRVRGRIQFSDLAYDSKHPLILPKCHGSLLLVRFAHFHNNHAGVQAMITFIREEYEMFGLRYMAKQVKKSCVSCQRVDSRVCNEIAAPLPKIRVTMAPAFSVTGIDFAGPVFCRDFPQKKYYICLFACGVIRAVHMELTESLTAEDFVLAFRRFCALRRVPSIVYSDNGKNLVAGQRILNSYLGPLSPTWRLNCPLAPWWGGWWERLVRSVKSAIKKTLGKQLLCKVELETCLCEVAASINSRPLTFVGTDIDSSVPLTPNHFLSGQGSQSLGSRVLEDPERVNAATLSLRQQEMLERTDDFWKVWSNSYLKNLPPAVQKFKKSGNLKVGSVVVIRDEQLPRMSWKVGVVQKMFAGRDGFPRSAIVKTTKGELTRAIQKLHSLELCQSNDDVCEL